MNKTSVEILNAIRNGGSPLYQSKVNVATNDPDTLKSIGTVLTQNPNLANEFLSALVNRIGRVILTSKLFTNPIASFKKGMLDYGETIEEIFVDIAEPYQYDPAVAESNIFKREIPDVKSAFHILNYKKFYKSTIQDVDLARAFLSAEGVTELIAKIVDALYTSANYDEFLTMKYLLAKHILEGHLYGEDISSANTTKDMVKSIKEVSNNIEFPSRNYNMMGVQNFTLKENQYLIVSSKFDADMDVNVLASAFNMDKAQFLGHRVLIDSFGSLDTARLDKLFADEPNYQTLTSDELKALDEIPAVLIDENFFMIFDALFKFTEQYNGEGIYWNYWYHTWKVFSVSPFANAIVFVPSGPSVTSVTVSPSTATVDAGETVQLSATVVAEPMADLGVTWSSASEAVATVDANGLVTVKSDATSAATVVITATSKQDSTKTGTATITVG